MFSATKFVVAGVIVALFGGFLLISQPFDERGGSVPGAAAGDAGTFSPAGSLAQPRAGHTATLLPDGRVLIVGGVTGLEPFGHTAEPPRDVATATAEIWDPGTDTFGPTGSLAEPRLYHTATLLPDGRVLVIGGLYDDGDLHARSAEVWDPSTGTFSPAGSIVEAHRDQTATLLPDGRVLVFGSGSGPDDGVPTSAEAWDPATSTFSPVGLVVADYFTATALADGRVLIVGDGENPFGNEDPASAEVWDPATSTFSPAGSSALIWISSATLLADGRVLIIGESVPDGNEDPMSLEVWDPDTDTFEPTGSPTETGSGASTTALPDGRALIVGGCGYVEQWGCVDWFDSAEVWDPETETFGPTGSLSVTRSEHTTTALPDGRVLVIGGWGEPVGNTCEIEREVERDCLVVHASAEVWEPSGG